jgi:hypothetical protein
MSAESGTWLRTPSGDSAFITFVPAPEPMIALSVSSTYTEGLTILIPESLMFKVCDHIQSIRALIGSDEAA